MKTATYTYQITLQDVDFSKRLKAKIEQNTQNKH